MATELKRILYSNQGIKKSSADYAVFDYGDCVFSGVTKDGKSTINAAEDIIRIISRAEGIPLTFFDLQTRLGYGHYKEGEYFLNLLIVINQQDPQVVEWRRVQFPRPDVFRVFQNHIGLNLREKRD